MPTNSVRGVTLNSAGGAIALNSERNRIVLDANATVNIESETSSVYIRPMNETIVQVQMNLDFGLN